MKRILTVILVICICSLPGFGQVETKSFSGKNAFDEVPILKKRTKASAKKYMPTFDVDKMLKEDKVLEGKDVPFRFGKGFDVNLTLADGVWSTVAGGRLWSLDFESKGAYSINFIFNNFYLPDGANLYIANADGSMLYGPVTSQNNTKTGFFMTDLIAGDNVTIFLFEPSGKQGLSKLTIQRVVHAYKPMYSESQNNLKSYGLVNSSKSCNNDIACYSDWGIHSEAVALVLLSNGAEWCSGSLLMTADNSFKPYFLSAFHCVDINSANGSISTDERNAAQNWMFKFRYKKITCNGSSTTIGTTFNSATFRAAWFNTDFVLMEMNTTPKASSDLSWLGWDRSGSTPTNGTGIHHPAGDVMKISFDNHTLTTAGAINWAIPGGFLTTPAGTHWNVGFDNGSVEGGSSGSPLFNQNRRVVGQLHGGPENNCSYPITGNYGKFSSSWTGGGTNDTRLSNWLDPTNTGVTTTNTSRLPLPAEPDRSTLWAGKTGIFCLPTSIPSESYNVSNLTWRVTPSMDITITPFRNPNNGAPTNCVGVKIPTHPGGVWLNQDIILETTIPELSTTYNQSIKVVPAIIDGYVKFSTGIIRTFLELQGTYPLNTTTNYKLASYDVNTPIEIVVTHPNEPNAYSWEKVENYNYGYSTLTHSNGSMRGSIWVGSSGKIELKITYNGIMGTMSRTLIFTSPTYKSMVVSHNNEYINLSNPENNDLLTNEKIELETKNYTYDIFTISGTNAVKQGKFVLPPNGLEQVNISALPNGIYILTIYENGKNIHSEKFSINR